MGNKKYYEVSSYFVIDEIKKGISVYMLDKQEKAVITVKDLTVCQLVSILNSDDVNDRYYFYEILPTTEDDSDA